jgi:hypothetical protein
LQRLLDAPLFTLHNASMLQRFYPGLLAAHNLLRWLVLVAGLAATISALRYWSSPPAVDSKPSRSAILFVASMDLQFLLGLILYLGASPVVHQAFENLSAAMKVHEMRFFVVEHSLLMLLAVAFAHVGGALARKSKLAPGKIRGAASFFALSVLAILAGMPWFRPLLRFS